MLCASVCCAQLTIVVSANRRSFMKGHFGAGGNTSRTPARLRLPSRVPGSGHHRSAYLGHQSASFSSTTSRRASFSASLQGCGRRARCHAARSARWARYRLRPPLRVNSRDIVDAARPNRPAITRNDSPAATPREISSRSTSDSCRSDRVRGAGRTPPTSSNNLRIDDPFLPSRRAIDRVGSPAFRRSHTSAISASVNLLDTPHLPAGHHNSRRWCCVHALRRQHICATGLPTAPSNAVAIRGTTMRPCFLQSVRMRVDFLNVFLVAPRYPAFGGSLRANG